MTEQTEPVNTEAPETDDAASDAAAAEASEAKPQAEADPALRVLELTERLQRVSADYANYQKRVQRDKRKWTEDAVRGVLKGLLPVLDNLDQAIAAFEGDVKDPATYKQGVELVRGELLRQLGMYQVARIEPETGAAFDTELHEGIMVQEVEGIDAEQVSFMARVGYKLGETVLRPAQVGVARPKVKPKPAGEADAE